MLGLETEGMELSAATAGFWWALVSAWACCGFRIGLLVQQNLHVLFAIVVNLYHCSIHAGSTRGILLH